MINNYVYGPITFPYIGFDARFAGKYGIVEAIIFNFLYYDFMTASQAKRYGGWHKEDGWMERGGRLWRRHSENYLFRWLFDETQQRNAINHLCSEGLLYLCPSLTEGYCWISIGEEAEGA